MPQVASKRLVFATLVSLTVLLAGVAPAIAAAPATNDDFDDAKVIAQGSLTYIDEVDTTAATAEGFEVDSRCGNSGNASVWYRVTAWFDGWLRADTRGSENDPLLTVYEGTSSAALTEIACNDDFGADTDDSKATFQVVAGNQYNLRVAGDPTNQVNLNVARVHAPVNDDFASARNLDAGQRYFRYVRFQNATFEYDEPDAEVAFDGDCPLIDPTVWYTIQSPTTRVVNANTQLSEFDTAIALYSGTSIDALTPIQCNDDTTSETGFGLQSNVSFIAEAGTRYYLQVGGFEGQQGLGRVRVRTVTPLANDMFASAEPMLADGSPHIRLTRLATVEAGEPVESSLGSCSGSAYSSVWYRFDAPATGNFVLDSDGADYDHQLSIYTGSSVEALTELQCSNFGGDITFAADQGQTYWIRAGGRSGDSGLLHLHLAPAT